MSARNEQLLQALLSGEALDMEPQSRTEEYLLNLLRGEKPTRAPQSRTDALLCALAEQGMGGGSGGSGGGGSTDEWIGDGNTHLWVELGEGRTSVFMALYLNGTATIDWGDGTEPDTVTGSSLWNKVESPMHDYANGGKYVITITITGSLNIQGYSDGATIQYPYIFMGKIGSSIDIYHYPKRIKKVEIGNGVTYVASNAFRNASSVEAVKISQSVAEIQNLAFAGCQSLKSINIPNSVTKLSANAFAECKSISAITLPNIITTIESRLFQYCTNLMFVDIPDGVTTINGEAFYGCESLATIDIPASVTTIAGKVFYNCRALKAVDFTKHTAVPTLSGTNAFYNTPSDCEIRVPSALADEWKAATNWATDANKIVGV